jgi:hypothetical protein
MQLNRREVLGITTLAVCSIVGPASRLQGHEVLSAKNLFDAAASNIAASDNQILENLHCIIVNTCSRDSDESY